MVHTSRARLDEASDVSRDSGIADAVVGRHADRCRDKLVAPDIISVRNRVVALKDVLFLRDTIQTVMVRRLRSSLHIWRLTQGRRHHCWPRSHFGDTLCNRASVEAREAWTSKPT